MTESNVKIGLRVVRGRDWPKQYGNQDGNPPGKGTITKKHIKIPKKWFVKWDHDGSSNSYSVGKDGEYHLQIAYNVRSSEVVKGKEFKSLVILTNIIA